MMTVTDVPGDRLLVGIAPSLIGQRFGLGGEDIHNLVLAPLFLGDSLFPIPRWPFQVYVARVVNGVVPCTHLIRDNQLEVLARGLLYQSLADATEAVAALSS